VRVSESPLDRNDVNAIIGALFDINAKADRILDLLLEDEDEEEEDDDHS
jgi:hypothetical protein